MSKVVDVRVLTHDAGRRYVTVAVETDDGLVGYGDGTLNGLERVVATYLERHISPLLIGRDARDTSDLWNFLHKASYWRGGPVGMSALGAIDCALWDIQGKRWGVPVFELLGGRVRRGVKAYGHATGGSAEDLVRSVCEHAESGFSIVRAQIPWLAGDGAGVGSFPYRPDYSPESGVVREDRWDVLEYVREAPKALEEVCQAAPRGVSVVHDVHHRLSIAEARRFLRDVEGLGLLWLEDIVPKELYSQLAQVRSESTTPLAVGETVHSLEEARPLFAVGVDYLRMAVPHSGGLSHMRDVASVANFSGVRLAPHGPIDISPVGQAANVHLGLASSAVSVQEYMLPPEEAAIVFSSNLFLRDGLLSFPQDTVGLGVDVKESAMLPASEENAWLPTLRNDDGSVSPW